MVMDSWFGSAWDATTAEPDPEDPNTGDVPYARPLQGPVYGPPAPTYGGINPNQGGFRGPENPANVTPGDQYAPNPDMGIFTPFHPVNEVISPYLQTASDYATQAGELGFGALADLHSLTSGGYGTGYSGPEGAQAAGGFVGSTLVPQSVEEIALNSLGGGGITGYDDLFRGLGTARGAAEDVFRAGMPERNPFGANYGAGIPPGGQAWDEALHGPLPFGLDNFQRGERVALPPSAAPEPRVGGFTAQEAYDAAYRATPGSPADKVLNAEAARQEVLSGERLPGSLSAIPVDVDGVLTMPNRLGDPLAYNPMFGPPPEADAAMRDLGLSPDPLARPDMAQELSQRMDTPTLAPDEITMNPTQAANARDAEDAARQAYIDRPLPENPQATPFDAEALRRGDNGSVARAVEEAVGRPLAQPEAEAIAARTSRPLETPANSPEGIAERAGIGQAPTRAQALEDAQQVYATRVQEQADRFRAGNGRDMTPTEYQRMSETERMASGIQPEQVRAGVLDWLNLPRSLMTGIDLSFALRQMVLQAPSHPVEWAKSVATGIRSAFSEDYAEQVAKRIADSPLAPVHQNLYIAPSARGAGTIAQREEQYATALLDRIPILGAIYRPFERGNTAMINQFRADVADNFAKNTLSLKGETLANISPATQRQINIYDNFVNRATGRGTLGDLDKTLAPLGQVFFSLRNTIAKPQVVASLASKPFTPAWNQMVKDTAGFLALGATTLYLADSAGLKVGVDPRSADFGKIQAGDRHIDIWGGWQQQARAIFQTVQGARGESNFVNGAGKESTKSPVEVALPWLGNRASPQAGLVGQGLRALAENKTDGGPVLDALRGMFPDYKAPGPNAATAFNYLTPLSIQDTATALKSEGLSGGLQTGLMSFFGVGVQTYPNNANPRTAAVNNVMSKPENLAALPPNVAAFLQDKTWNEATPKEQRAILEKLSPEERTAIQKGEQALRDKQDIFQLNRDETTHRYEVADKQREALQPLADRLLADWKSGEMNPAQAVAAIKQVEASADKAAGFAANLGPKLSESPAYVNTVKGLPDNKSDGQKEVDLIREITGKYNAIYEDPRVTKPDGTKDFDKIEATRKAMMDAIRQSDPGFANRVDFNLKKDSANDFELSAWITKIDAQLKQLGYFDLEKGGKTAFQKANPQVDALVSLEYGGPVHSQDAARILLTLAPERKDHLSFAK